MEERQFTRNAAICERETKEWEGAAVLVSNIIGIMPSEPIMSPETVGLFCGRCTTFDVRKERVLIGRSTKSLLKFFFEIFKKFKLRTQC